VSAISWLSGYLPSTVAANVSSSYSPVDARVRVEKTSRPDTFLLFRLVRFTVIATFPRNGAETPNARGIARVVIVVIAGDIVATLEREGKRSAMCACVVARARVFREEKGRDKSTPA
jgi:hypothetical protein